MAEPIPETQAPPGLVARWQRAFRRHYRLAAVAWLLVVLAGVPVAWVKGRSTYVAEAVFQVSPTYMKNIEADKEVELQSNSQYREYVNHLSSSVVRYDVLQRALASLKSRGIDTRPSSLTERKYVEHLQRTVYVRAIPDTYMVRIGTEDHDREHLHELINAITESFLATTRTEQIYGSTERLDVLKDGVAKLRAEVAGMEAERVVLAEKLGLTTFGENTVNPYDAMLAQAREKLTNAAIDRMQAEAAHEAFVRQREVPTHLGRSLLEMRLQDNGLQALRNEVVKRAEELNRITAGLEPKHPARQAATAELASITQRLQAKEAEFDRHTFENFRARLSTTLNQHAQVEKDVQKTLARLEGQATEFASTFQRAMRLTSEIRKREDELAKLRDRLNYLDTEANALGFVRLVSAALPAETPRGPGKTKLMLLFILVGLGLAVAVPLGLDLLDRRVRSVSDAERIMGIPAAGWQIRAEDLPTRLFAEEQTRRFASTLMRNRARTGRRAFAFTSVKPDAGVTVTILDTASVLAQLGTRVLVIEANTFAPSARFSALQPGLTDCLGGKASAHALPRPHVHRNAVLDVVGVGAERDSGLKRLDVFRQAIEDWSAKYDYLLVDLPPLPLSSDAEMLIEALGQVFLVVQAECETKGEVDRARRLLQRMDPEAVGLFVNRVPLLRGADPVEALIVESITGERFSRFMSLPRWRLGWEVLRARLALARRRAVPSPAADARS